VRRAGPAPLAFAASALVAAVAALAASPLRGQEPIRARGLGGARPESAALALSGGEGGDLRLTVAAWPLPAPEGTGGPTVLLVVEADGQSLLRRSETPALPLEWTVYALGADGAVTGFLAEGARIEGREEVVDTGVRFTAALALPAGLQSLRVLVRHRASGAFGVRKVDVEAGAATGAFALLPPPEAEPWVEVRSGTIPETPSPLLAALLAAGPSALPAARPEGGGRIAVWPPPEAAPRVELTAEGASSPVAAGEALPAAGGASPGVALFELPSLAAPPGLYRLALAGAPAAGARVAIVPSGAALPPRGWPALFAQAGAPVAAEAAGAPPPEPSPAESAGAAELERAFAASYLAALVELGAGAPERAVAWLAEQEAAAVASERREALRHLGRAQDGVVARLAARDAEVLLPIADLHRRLFAAHLGAGHPGLARQSLEQAVAATRRYAGAATDPEDRRLAAASFLGLAATLFESSIPRRAAELAAEAEKLVPGHAAALLAQVVVLERAQQHREALSLLDRLLKSEPGHREARLRRALVDQRTGAKRGPERELRALVEEPARDWVSAVAAQELARRLVEDRRAEEAARMLAAAEARLGEEGGLAVARAWAEERSGRRGAALTHLERIPPPSRLRGDSPRRRYGRWPEEALQAERRAAIEAALLRCPVLAAALEAAGGETAK